MDAVTLLTGKILGVRRDLTTAEERHRDRERLRIWEWSVDREDSDGGAPVVWDVTLPRYVLLTNLPITCRYSPNYFFFRIVAGALLGLTVFLIAMAVCLALWGIPMGFFPPFPIGAAASPLGFWAGARVAPSPWWGIRRIWYSDTDIEIRPLVHTGLRGEQETGYGRYRPSENGAKVATATVDSPEAAGA